MNSKELINQIIPLPQKIRITDSVVYSKKRIEVNILCESSVKIETALDILSLYTSDSQFKSDFIISLSLLEKEGKIKGLLKAKYKEQCYAIKPVMVKKVFKGLEIKAYTDLGLLYGVRTLAQAIDIEKDEVTIPMITVFDWPDIEFRGQWGGTSNEDIAYVTQYKYNAIDGKVLLDADENGNAVVTHNQALYDMAEKYGVDIAATISHLESIAKNGLIENKKDVLNTPSKERKERSDYYPGICMSSDATKKMITDWFKKIAVNPSVKKILVWLSEEETKCYCSKCIDEEPYSLEVKCLLFAYQELKKDYPYIEFGIMLSQGSFKVTENIAKLLPKDVTLTYYDGGRTYDSGKYEMVLPSLYEYSKRGGKLGIYPQITHSWRTVFPMSSPYFIKYRCDEFVKKGLNRVIGYAVPDNRYHDYNLLAFLEWLWNNKGRSEKQFTHSYAAINNLDGNLYYRYIKALENPSWDLAHSKLFVRLIYNYPLVLRSSLEFDDHRFEMAEMLPIKNYEADIKKVNEAITIAQEMDNTQLVVEAKCILGGLMAYKGITKFINEIKKETIDEQILIESYKTTKKSSNIVYKNVLKWSKLILTENENHHKRVTDTAVILFRVVDGMKKYFDTTNVKVSKKQRVLNIGEWDESDFNHKTETLLTYDITDILVKHDCGTYHICLDYIDSKSGTDTKNIYIKEIQRAGGEKTIAKVVINMNRLSVWSPWKEYMIKVNSAKYGCQYKLCMEVSGMEKGENTCRGMVGIRKVN